MARDLILAARLMLDSQRWAAGLSQAGRQTRGFVNAARNEFAQLRGFMQSTTGVLAQVGAGYTLGRVIGDSAKTDQALTRIQQTAGMTREQTAKLRRELHGMAGDTGTVFDSLQEGFGQLIAGGLAFEASLPTIEAINKGMRVTGSEATTLATALQAAQEHFQFDLAKPGQALELLDKMTVAGRAGVIEIEDLSNVFATAAPNAKAAKLEFEEFLALIEGLGTATTKDRVGTLVDSTLRVFTNANYMKEAQKATGIKFFDAKGERRNALDVIADIKRKFDKLKTDQQRHSFISQAFGKADLDTVKGIQAAMRDGKLEKILAIAKEAQAASGTLNRDLAGAMDNSVAQAGVLKERLAAAGDRFAQPINKALSATIQKLTGKKEQGGMDLSGGQLLGGGAAALGSAYVLSRVMKGPLARLLGRVTGGAAGLGTGVAMGSALEKAGAATPVFIVGAAPGLFAGGVGGVGGATGLAANAAATATAAAVGRKIGTTAILAAAARTVGVGTMARMGVAGAATVGAGVTAAAVGGYAVGTGIHALLEKSETGRKQLDMLGRDINRLQAFFGNKEAQRALDGEKALKAMLAKEGVDAAFKGLPTAVARASTPAPAAAAANALPAVVSMAGRAPRVQTPPGAIRVYRPTRSQRVTRRLRPAPRPLPKVVVAPRIAAPIVRVPPLLARPVAAAPLRAPRPLPAVVPMPRRAPAASRPDFRNVIAKFSSTEAATIAAAIAGKLTAKPLRGELDVTVTDKRTTVTARPGGDFTNVRSSVATRQGLNTGRAMGDRR